MARKFKIGDRVKIINCSRFDHLVKTKFDRKLLDNRRLYAEGKIEDIIPTPYYLLYKVNHCFKVKLSNTQFRELVKSAVYHEDELILVDNAGNPKKENPLIIWLTN